MNRLIVPNNADGVASAVLKIAREVGIRCDIVSKRDRETQGLVVVYNKVLDNFLLNEITEAEKRIWGLFPINLPKGLTFSPVDLQYLIQDFNAFSLNLNVIRIVGPTESQVMGIERATYEIFSKIFDYLDEDYPY